MDTSPKLETSPTNAPLASGRGAYGAPDASKKDWVKRRLVEDIQRGRYRPGDRLRQDHIAAELGTSSTPVREALTELCSSGLLSREAHRGVQVAELDAVGIGEVYQARKIIERETARLAFPHLGAQHLERLRALHADMRHLLDAGRFEELSTADEAFHSTIFEASGNRHLVAAVETLWSGFPRYLMWNLEGRRERSAAEHAHMIDALAAGDADAFVDAVADHLDNSLSAILDHLAATGGA